MASDELHALSQDELRKRLYQTFKNRGVLDTLKTQLRNQLIRELKHPTSGGELHSPSGALEGDSLLIRASNSLVADHLRCAGYEYTLSVFYPECGLEKERGFTTQDLLQLMKVNPKSRLYKSLQTSGIQQEHRRGILLHVLMELTEYHLQKESRDADTQTISTPPYKESVVEKLQLIDEQFADINPQRQKFESLEGKLAVYRKEMEQQLHAEMSQKLQYFKDVEIAKIQLEEKEKSRKEIADVRKELEKTYQIKSDGLMTRERNAIERLQKNQEIEAKEGYAQRQNLLRDIEMVRSREANLKQRMEAFELAEKLQEERKRSVEDALRRRELSVKNIEDTFDQKLKNELLKYEIELKEDYMKRTYKLTEDEKRNREEAMRVREESIVINSKKDELEYSVSRASELEIELNSVKAQVSLLTRQNQALSEQLKETMDYHQLKEEKLNHQTQIKRLKEQLEEINKENQHFRDRISYPTAEQLALQAQTQRVENARKQDRDEFETHKDILEKQLQLEVERCAELKIQLLNSEDTNKRMIEQMDDLKLQLRQTQQALENEVYRNPKPSLVDRSILDLTADRIVPHDFYIDGTLLKSQALSDAFVEAGGVQSPRSRQRHVRRSSSPNSDIEFVATTKARIKELEKEADYLEEAYRNYQNRVIRAAGKSSPQAKLPSPTFLRSVISKAPSSLPNKVTFVEETFTSQQLPLTRLTGQKHNGIVAHDGSWTADSTPLRRSAPSPKLHSSTPLSKVINNSNTSFSEDINGSYIANSHHSPEHHLSPIPRQGPLSSAASASVVQAPPFPKTDGQMLSSHQPQADAQESIDFSKPRKLTFEDLHKSDSSLQSQADIPEKLESDASDPSVEIVNGDHVATTKQAITASQQDTTIGQVQSEKQNLADEEKNWEEERREREERRQQERQEAFEKEQKELENLEKEKSLKEDPPGTDEDKEGIERQKQNSAVLSREDPSDYPSANTLEKYMQIILQNVEQDVVDKSSRKEIIEDISLTERQSDEKDDSIAAMSRGETDEDFW